MQNTPSSAADQLLYLVLAVLYLLVVATLVCGVLRGLLFYGRWLKKQTGRQRRQMGLLHISPVIIAGLIYLTNPYDVPPVVEVLLGLAATVSILGHVCTLFFVGFIHGLSLMQKGHHLFKTSPAWRKTLLVVVSLDLLWSWVQQW